MKHSLRPKLLQCERIHLASSAAAPQTLPMQMLLHNHHHHRRQMHNREFPLAPLITFLYVFTAVTRRRRRCRRMIRIRMASARRPLNTEGEPKTVYPSFFLTAKDPKIPKGAATHMGTIGEEAKLLNLFAVSTMPRIQVGRCPAISNHLTGLVFRKCRARKTRIS